MITPAYHWGKNNTELPGRGTADPLAEFSQGQKQTSDKLAFLRKVQQVSLIYKQVAKASGIPKVREERESAPGLLFSPEPGCS